MCTPIAVQGNESEHAQLKHLRCSSVTCSTAAAEQHRPASMPTPASSSAEAGPGGQLHSSGGEHETQHHVKHTNQADRWCYQVDPRRGIRGMGWAEERTTRHGLSRGGGGGGGGASYLDHTLQAQH